VEFAVELQQQTRVHRKTTMKAGVQGRNPRTFLNMPRNT